MIDTIINGYNPSPFYYKQVDSVIISDDPIVLDLFFMKEVNGLILKNFESFYSEKLEVMQNYIEILKEEDLYKLKEVGFSDKFNLLLLNLLTELKSTLLGVQITAPKIEMCPEFHVDKVPLRLVQCLDGVGTTLRTHKGQIIEAQKNDLILLKGELWESEVGALEHRSPETDKPRSLVRIDFLD